MQTNYIAGPYTTNRAIRRKTISTASKTLADAAVRGGVRYFGVIMTAMRYNSVPSYRNNKLSTVQRSLMDRGLSRRQARRLSHATNQIGWDQN